MRLKEFSSKAGVEMGLGIAYELSKDVPGLLDLAASEFDTMLIDWDISWANVEETRNEIVFKNDAKKTNATEYINWCMDNSLKVHAQHLLWGHAYPQWLKEITSESEIEEVIRRHVCQMTNVFKGKIDYWTVVNEAGLPGYDRPDFLYDALGIEYIRIAFEAARLADPSVKLIYNDGYNHIQGWPLYNISKQVVDYLASESLIDGVGLQMHLDGAHYAQNGIPGKDAMIAAMQSYGVPVYITELDVNIKDIPIDDKQRFFKQAELFKIVIEAALESGVCEGILLMGIGDKHSWIEIDSSYDLYSPNADPTAWDDCLNPKPAYYEMRCVLCKNSL